MSFINFFPLFFFLFQRTSGLGSLGTSKTGDPHLRIGIIVPHSYFNTKQYFKEISNAVADVNKDSKDAFSFLKKYKFGCGRIRECEDVKMIMLPSSPSPRSKTYSNIIQCRSRLKCCLNTKYIKYT